VTSADDALLLELVHEASPHLLIVGPETETWLSRLEDQHDALHGLVEILLTTKPSAAVDLAAALWRFWWLRGHVVEGRAFLERARGIQGAANQEVLKGLGTIAFRQGDLGAAEEAFSGRLELAERSADQRGLADALADMARTALRRGDFAAVRSFAERGYEAAKNFGPDAVRGPLHMRAAAARMEGRFDEARSLYLESRAINERLGNGGRVAGEDHNLLYVALHTGDRAEAERRFRASSEWIFAHDDAYLRPYALLDAGVLALHDRDFRRAGHLVACAQRIFEETGSVPDPDDRVELDGAIAQLEVELGEGFTAVWTEGRKLAWPDAQRLAGRKT
jgi:tetratricopeptide (TPR) repeat protein